MLIYPGVFIKRVYLEANHVFASELAKKLKMSEAIVSRLLNEKSRVSPEMALKLSKVLGRSPESWLIMQDNYDLWKTRQAVNLEEYEPLKFAS